MTDAWITYYGHTLLKLAWLLWIGLCVWWLAKPERTADFLFKAFFVASFDWIWAIPPLSWQDYLIRMFAIATAAWVASLPARLPRKETVADTSNPPPAGAGNQGDQASSSGISGPGGS